MPPCCAGTWSKVTVVTDQTADHVLNGGCPVYHLPCSVQILNYTRVVREDQTRYLTRDDDDSLCKKRKNNIK